MTGFFCWTCFLLLCWLFCHWKYSEDMCRHLNVKTRFHCDYFAWSKMHCFDLYKEKNINRIKIKAEKSRFPKMLQTPLRQEVSNAESSWLYQYVRNYPIGQKSTRKKDKSVGRIGSEKQGRVKDIEDLMQPYINYPGPIRKKNLRHLGYLINQPRTKQTSYIPKPNHPGHLIRPDQKCWSFGLLYSVSLVLFRSILYWPV